MSTPDHVLPFQLERPNLRGRFVRLGPVLSTIIARHTYPAPVAQLLAEALSLAALLAGMLKFDGVFTLQAKTDGAVRMLVVDITKDGALRGYAQFDADKLAALKPDADARTLLGQGYLAFTVDQGEGRERYQGMVELTGKTLTDFIQHYFRQSEQIDTAFKVSAFRDVDGAWRAGALMLQRLPEQSGPVREDVEDDWRRAMLLMDTATPFELAGPELEPEEVLYRLFHEEEVRVYPLLVLRDECRCSRERVANVLGTLSPADRADALHEGAIEVTCEFCSRSYRFTAEEI